MIPWDSLTIGYLMLDNKYPSFLYYRLFFWKSLKFKKWIFHKYQECTRTKKMKNMIFHKYQQSTRTYILGQMIGHSLKNILRLRPCRRPLWQSQASWLLAWRLGNVLIGSLACWVLLSVFCFASTACWSVCWFSGCWMLVSMLFFWYLQLPRYSP